MKTVVVLNVDTDTENFKSFAKAMEAAGQKAVPGTPLQYAYFNSAKDKTAFFTLLRSLNVRHSELEPDTFFKGKDVIVEKVTIIDAKSRNGGLTDLTPQRNYRTRPEIDSSGKRNKYFHNPGKSDQDQLKQTGRDKPNENRNGRFNGKLPE